MEKERYQSNGAYGLQPDKLYYKDGEPCGHPGCLNHATHPCEKCGRIAGITTDPKYRIAELEAEIKRLKKRLELQSSYCDRKHAFCPDCRDKLPDDFCWRCKVQKLKKELEFYKNKCSKCGSSLGLLHENECPLCNARRDLADRDKREGNLVTDLADFYEKYNELQEAAAEYLECSLPGIIYLNDAEYRVCHDAGRALRAILNKSTKGESE